MTLTTTYGAVHDVLLSTAAVQVQSLTPGSLRLLLAITELGGTVEGASHTLVGACGSNSTSIRRAALELADAGLVTSTSKRGVGMRLALTALGRSLADDMLAHIQRTLDATGAGGAEA